MKELIKQSLLKHGASGKLSGKAVKELTRKELPEASSSQIETAYLQLRRENLLQIAEARGGANRPDSMLKKAGAAREISIEWLEKYGGNYFKNYNFDIMMKNLNKFLEKEYNLKINDNTLRNKVFGGKKEILKFIK
jgi:hypothetical protein